MKVSFETFRKLAPLKGWCVWDVDWFIGQVSLCHWWAYPFMKLYCWIRYLRIGLYHWLNHIGVMRTPLGNKMVLSDIWRRLKDDS